MNTIQGERTDGRTGSRSGHVTSETDREKRPQGAASNPWTTRHGLAAAAETERAMNGTTKNQTLSRTVAATALALAASTLNGWAGNGSECYVANVSAPVVTADGASYPAGTVRFCTGHRFTPSRGLHALSAGGRRAGMFLSTIRKSEVEVADGDALFYFDRGSDGRLSLRGVAVKATAGATLFDLDAPKTAAIGGAYSEEPESSPVVYVATRVH